MPVGDEIIKEIKQRAWLDAIEYQRQYQSDSIPTKFVPRYEELILQRYYESQFLCYLSEVRDSQFKADNTDKEI